jgi:molybdate transport system ATP-binding protein
VSALLADFELEAGGFRLEVQLALDEGVLMLFGPSGSGKSLTVSALAGLRSPTRGRIEVAGRTLFDSERGIHLPARHRRIGYVPQHHSLFPFLDVAANVAFGLPRARRKRGDPGVRALLEELDLEHLADARPGSLSGGERQRVALARALAVEPGLLLLDEPFASIDQAGRKRLRGVVRETLIRHGIPAVFVTHSVPEAIELGDRLALYERGRTVRTGTPTEVLRPSRLTLQGVRATAVEGDDGQVRLELDRASITGPADQLRVDADGRLHLVLAASDDES